MRRRFEKERKLLIEHGMNVGALADPSDHPSPDSREEDTSATVAAVQPRTATSRKSEAVEKKTEKKPEKKATGFTFHNQTQPGGEGTETKRGELSLSLSLSLQCPLWFLHSRFSEMCHIGGILGRKRKNVEQIPGPLTKKVSSQASTVGSDEYEERTSETLMSGGRAELAPAVHDSIGAEDITSLNPLTPSTRRALARETSLSDLNMVMVNEPGSNVEYSPADCSKQLNDILSDFNYFLTSALSGGTETPNRFHAKASFIPSIIKAKKLEESIDPPFKISFSPITTSTPATYKPWGSPTFRLFSPASFFSPIPTPSKPPLSSSSAPTSSPSKESGVHQQITGDAFQTLQDVLQEKIPLKTSRTGSSSASPGHSPIKYRSPRPHGSPSSSPRKIPLLESVDPADLTPGVNLGVENSPSPRKAAEALPVDVRKALVRKASSFLKVKSGV